MVGQDTVLFTDEKVRCSSRVRVRICSPTEWLHYRK
jgi:hypothetical protein